MSKSTACDVERIMKANARFSLKIKSAVTGERVETNIACYEESDSIERKAKYVASAIQCLASGPKGWEFNPGDIITIVNNPTSP